MTDLEQKNLIYEYKKTRNSEFNSNGARAVHVWKNVNFYM